jgi:hypothetical protein
MALKIFPLLCYVLLKPTDSLQQIRKSCLASSMMTTIDDDSSHNRIKIDHLTKLLFFGSCFSENMFSELKSQKFDAFANPQGIMFNPFSISSSVHNVVNNRPFTSKDLFCDSLYNETYLSWQHHSSFSSSQSDALISKMNTAITSAHDHLLRTGVIFITLGTAKIYSLKEAKHIVANCHKGGLF